MAKRTERPEPTSPRFGRPIALPGGLGALAHALGGTSKLAERLGVSTRAIQNWAKGNRVPLPPIRLLLVAVAKEHGLSVEHQRELATLNAPAAERVTKRARRIRAESSRIPLAADPAAAAAVVISKVVPKRARTDAPIPFGRPVELPGALGELARAVGGTTELARRMGVSARTLQRWATKQPSQLARTILCALAREVGLSAEQQATLATLNCPTGKRQMARRDRG